MAPVFAGSSTFDELETQQSTNGKFGTRKHATIIAATVDAWEILQYHSRRSEADAAMCKWKNKQEGLVCLGEKSLRMIASASTQEAAAITCIVYCCLIE